jgi:ligand-binding SRPBCC domain-containing protein
VDVVTWQATHLGVKQKLTVKISQMTKPFFFEDIMLKGAFKLMKHKHFFEKSGNGTVMKDEFVYEAPFGIIGKFFNKVYLKGYMTNFLKKRNEFLKNLAESKIRDSK